MHNADLILTLTSALAAGLILGYITHQLKMSPIVGYLLAGIVVGPYTPGFAANQHLVEQLAEVGVMLLMFGVGIHFHIEDLLAVKRAAISGAVVQIAVATLLGAWVTTLFGWSLQSGIVFGLALSVASTVVLTRVLVDNRALHSQTGRLAIGWLVVEDLFTVIALVVLPILLDNNGSTSDLVTALAFVVLKVMGVLGALFVFGKRLIPWLFTRAGRSSSQELFTLTVLVTALGISVGATLLFDVSMALGAFLAGMVVGKSEFGTRAASEVLPLRDAFAVLFFVSIGMLLDPTILLDNWGVLLASLLVVIVGKGVAASLIVLFLGYPIKVALGVSVALAQIGEFSFILASLGKQLQVIDDLVMNTLVATSIISITLNPILYRLIPYVDDWIAKHPRLLKALSPRGKRRVSGSEAMSDHIGDSHTIIIGYGPIGRTVARLLRDNGIDSTIVELNLETTRKLSSQGVSVVYGDASRREILESANIRSAKALILTASSITNPDNIVRQAKQLNPDIQVIARTAYVRELVSLKSAGCETVFSGEGEVALALVEEVLRDLGATPEQVERERSRVRNEIFVVSGSS